MENGWKYPNYLIDDKDDDWPVKFQIFHSYLSSRRAGRSSRMFFLGAWSNPLRSTEFLSCWSLEEQNELTFEGRGDGFCKTQKT